MKFIAPMCLMVFAALALVNGVGGNFSAASGWTCALVCVVIYLSESK